jgi:hypothetical protein
MLLLLLLLALLLLLISPVNARTLMHRLLSGCLQNLQSPQ